MARRRWWIEELFLNRSTWGFQWRELSDKMRYHSFSIALARVTQLILESPSSQLRIVAAEIKDNGKVRITDISRGFNIYNLGVDGMYHVGEPSADYPIYDNENEVIAWVHGLEMAEKIVDFLNSQPIPVQYDEEQ